MDKQTGIFIASDRQGQRVSLTTTAVPQARLCRPRASKHQPHNPPRRSVPQDRAVFCEGQQQTLPEMAAELVRLRVDVIIARRRSGRDGAATRHRWRPSPSTTSGDGDEAEFRAYMRAFAPLARSRWWRARMTLAAEPVHGSRPTSASCRWRPESGEDLSHGR